MRRHSDIFPSVLVLSDEIPQTVNAGSILLQRLFRGYGEGEKLKSGNAEPEPQAETGPSQRLKIKSEAKLFVIGPKPHPAAQLLECPYRELRMPLRRLETSRFSVHKRSLQALGLIPLPSRRRVLDLLGDFRPDVIVTVMQNTPFICVAQRTAETLGIPLVLIVHDLNEEFEKVLPWARRALFEKNRRVYRAAARRLCVSAEMAEYLTERYGVPGEVMYPNRSEELQPRAAEFSLTLRASADQGTKRPKDQRSDEIQGGSDKGNVDIVKDPDGREARGASRGGQASAPLTLGYAGSLAYGYGEELVKLIDILREVGARIRMFSPQPRGPLDALNRATDVVEVCGYRPALEAWQEIQETCDAVILPYSNPAGANEQLYRTHFPSKLTEYLALGMPVIVSGPDFATGLRYAQGTHKWTEMRDQQSAEVAESNFDIVQASPKGVIPCVHGQQLVECLSRLRRDAEVRCELAERALVAGRKDFDPRVIIEQFTLCLRECAVSSDSCKGAALAGVDTA